VASASAPMVSMIRFTHSSCSTLSGMRPPTMAPTKLTMSATKFTVSWNCRNLRMEVNTLRPHSTDLRAAKYHHHYITSPSTSCCPSCAPNFVDARQDNQASKK
jgi:hypothetical protein